MNLNKLGHFKISMTMIRNPECHKELLKIMGNMVIVRAEQVFAGDCIEYTAISEYFEDVEVGTITPNYQFEVTKVGEEITINPTRIGE